MFSGKVYIALIFLSLTILVLLLSNAKTESIPVWAKQKGVCWVGLPQVITDTQIVNLKKFGVSWISQTPFGWQRNSLDTIIHTENKAQTPWWGESMLGISTTTALARKQGISTLLKPHIWVRNSWPGAIKMNSDREWRAWFRHYENFILPYAVLADSAGIKIFCIGTELHQTVNRPEWKALIKKIRGVYKGKLTYAANFSGEFEEVPFWNDLDYIGVQAYFPLASSKEPNLKELEQGWEEPITRIEKIFKKFRKPILFTELGYKSTPDAAIEPWRWPERQEDVSMETQANCYKAFFHKVWPLEWIAGVYFWKWYPHPPKHPTASDFTPQGKPAEEVLKNWFAKQ
jgi:hypothetical protein